MRLLTPQPKRGRSLPANLVRPAGIVTISQTCSTHFPRARISEFESYMPSQTVQSLRCLEPKLPYVERLIQSPHRAFGCFSWLMLNDRAAPSYQLLDLSLVRLTAR